MLPWARSLGGGMRAASIGVSVSATNSEIITATDTVMPNSRRNAPIRPVANATGRNTAATENVAAHAASVISRVPERAAASARRTALAVPLDVLEHDDRVVDHDADREREAQQRHRVQREVEHPDQAERGDDRERDRGRDDHRGPEAADEHEHDEHGEHAAEQRARASSLRTTRGSPASCRGSPPTSRSGSRRACACASRPCAGTNSSTIATELPFDCLERPSATPGLPFM